MGQTQSILTIQSGKGRRALGMRKLLYRDVSCSSGTHLNAPMKAGTAPVNPGLCPHLIPLVVTFSVLLPSLVNSTPLPRTEPVTLPSSNLHNRYQLQPDPCYSSHPEGFVETYFSGLMLWHLTSRGRGVWADGPGSLSLVLWNFPN